MATVLNRAACHQLAALHCAARANNRGTAMHAWRAACRAVQCTAHVLLQVAMMALRRLRAPAWMRIM